MGPMTPRPPYARSAAIEHEGRIQLEDTAVVRKDADGKVTIHNELASGTEAGIGIGAVLGGLRVRGLPGRRDRRRRRSPAASSDDPRPPASTASS